MLQMIETPSTISLKTNESQLYQKLGSIFTDKSKFISELLQNSRRAGATRINISFNETEEIDILPCL
ncbi:hypothetical protein [Undibacterium oligocarboniphilum]|uniref:hypothetical protein n=1 Tax=Undibacterium oligocarboniphilum TaxID=666702 RepID=UPI00168950BB|nr:hypothetical protein [Undibacterium oligocarboniphilum]MBC3871886.1 hypothetical protein [Undibacterium oligocarboniphilum]